MEHRKTLDEESSRYKADAEGHAKKQVKLESKVSELLASLDMTTKELSQARGNEHSLKKE